MRLTICCGTPDRIYLIGSDTLKVVVEPKPRTGTNKAVVALSFLSGLRTQGPRFIPRSVSKPDGWAQIAGLSLPVFRLYRFEFLTVIRKSRVGGL